ncbi:MAG TPA: hypothetical protein VJ725_19495 [Thermoanaerobaculia bacterium]|nr:hypothetical protein [Thermoanaerobaculia bacterium]
MDRRAALLVLLCLMALPAGAERLPKDRVPEPLRPWTEWALRGYEDSLCPFLLGSGEADWSAAETRCAWPGRLALDLGEREGQFRQEWALEVAGFVPLPGEESRWPLDLRVDGQPAAAVSGGSGPGVWLPAGRHVVEGAFRWDALPESLAVPPETGLVALSVRGTALPFPERDAQGRVFLQRSRSAEAAEESLEMVVHRRVVDEVPLLLITRIELSVAGKAREVLLGRALPDRFLPVALDAPLPARIEPGGRLRVQVRPGTWTIELTARHEGPAAALTAPDPGGPWATEEVWVFEARPSFRVVDVEGVPAVDPQQTRLPEDWKSLPAYRVRPGETMRFAGRRRGDADPAPDRLTLARVLWLDFDGGGYTWADQLTGTLARSWRLEMAPPVRLERVAVAGREQVITRRPGTDRAGIEVRQGKVLLGAEGRIEGRGALPAVGWDHDFQQVSGELHLPPGWRILGATGVDQVPGTWISEWTLLDLFLVLLIALAVRHLWGTRWGIVALAVMVLTWQEADAPRWIWVVVLSLEALRRLLPGEGWARSLVRVASLLTRAVLVLVTIGFVAGQVRQALYPALEKPWSAVGAGEVEDRTLKASLGESLSVSVPSRSDEEALQALGYVDGAVTPEPQAEAPAGAVATEAPPPPPPPPAPGTKDSRIRALRQPPEVDPRAVVTTGPGLPEWTWTKVDLRWNGPVESSQRMRFFLLSPAAGFVLTFVRVALLALLVLLTLELPGVRLPWRKLPAAAALLLAVLLLGAAPGVQAEEPPVQPEAPPASVLDQLREALTAPPDCFPECASSPRLFLEVSPAGLRLRFEVGAAAAVAVPIPGGAEQWVPAEVRVDGQPAGVARSADGRLWVRVSPGRHEVLLTGPLPARDVVQLPLPLKPHRVEVTASGWTVSGVHEDGEADDNLQLSRQETAGPAAAGSLQPSALPPFLEVERTLYLGLAWNVETRVSRRSPSSAPAAVEIPLLPGESVTTAGARVKNGAVQVSLGPGTDEFSWSSTLSPRSSLVLQAPKTLAWTEVWRLNASPLWHVEARGLPTVVGPEDAEVRVREWRPWPGERLELAITRPEGIAGRSLTIVRSVLEAKPGLRSTDVSLTLSVRSSRGGQHTVVLPEGAELTAVTVDGRAQPIRQEGRKVTLPIHPYSQTIGLSWRESRGISLFLRTPAVDLGAPSVNALTQAEIPASRWILLVGGPRLGPAVLFWSVLVVILLAAWGLGRVRQTPLRTRDWVLLGVGLSQVPLAAAALVAAWLLALGVRREKGSAIQRNKVFDLVQIALVVWTLVALGILFWSIQQGLLGLPDMQIAGNGSTGGSVSGAALRWYADRAGEVPPTAWVFSVPLLVYRGAMLAWALWLALALLRWLRWGWESLNMGGGWREWEWFRPRPAAGPPPPAPPAAPAG